MCCCIIPLTWDVNNADENQGNGGWNCVCRGLGEEEVWSSCLLSSSSRNLLDNTVLAANNTVLSLNTLVPRVKSKEKKNVSLEGRGEKQHL